MMETYRTDEGFDLPKPLLFPDVHDFRALFHADAEWDFATMGHRNGVPLPNHPAEITREGYDKVVDRFMSVEYNARPHLVVTPVGPLLDMLFDGAMPFTSRVSWQAIYHERTHRVLLIANGDIGSRWLAYVWPETMPDLRE